MLCLLFPVTVWTYGIIRYLEGSGLLGCAAGRLVVSSVSKHHNAFNFRVKQSKKNGHPATKNQKANERWRLVGSKSRCP
jgi:hypothetical protein